MSERAAPAADKLLADPPPPEPSSEAAAEAAAASAEKDTAPEAPKRSHKGKGAGATGKRPVGRPPKAKIGERLGALVAGIGVGVAAFNQADGFAIINGADELGVALEKWSEESPAVRRVLENLLEASAAGLVFVALAKIAVPIAANHELLPGNLAAAVATGNSAPMPAPSAPAEPSNGHSAN